MSNKHHFLILLLSFLVGMVALNAQDMKEIQFYQSTEDYRLNILDEKVYLIDIKKSDEETIFYKKIIDPLTGKRVKEAEKFWACRFEGSDYVNMRYSWFYSDKLFVKVDQKGNKYCLKFIHQSDKSQLRNPSDERNSYYGAAFGGLGALAAQKLEQKEYKFFDENEEWHMIVIADMTNIRPANRQRNEGSYFNLLSYSKIHKYLLFEDRKLKEVKAMNFSEILETIRHNDFIPDSLNLAPTVYRKD